MQLGVALVGTTTQEGHLKKYGKTHGPAGEPGVSPNTTDDVVILWFEGDPNTALSELENSDYGNWLNPEGEMKFNSQ